MVVLSAIEMSELESKNSDHKVPEWATMPFHDHIKYIERMNALVHLSIQGISSMRAAPQMFETLAKIRGETTLVSAQERIEQVKISAELAQREVDDGFPVLFAQATVSLWSSLESTVRLFVARWLENNPSAMQVEVIKRLRVRIGEYESLSGEDRFFYILDQFERELGSGMRLGISRFETILQPFGLMSEIEDDLRRDIFEMQQVRNIIMHRGGIADRRFVESCPWVNISIGMPVVVTHESFHKYMDAGGMFIAKLIKKVAEYFGHVIEDVNTSYKRRGADSLVATNRENVA